MLGLSFALSVEVSTNVLAIISEDFMGFSQFLNPLTPNGPYSSRTAPLTSKRCILYIYSTNIHTEYFKHGKYSPFFSSSKCSLFHNSNVFCSCIIHILYTGCAKIKKKSGAKRLKLMQRYPSLTIFQCLCITSDRMLQETVHLHHG